MAAARAYRRVCLAAFGDLNSLSHSFAGAGLRDCGCADTLALQLAFEQAVGTAAEVGLVYDGEIGDGLTRHSLTGRGDAKF